MRPWPFGRRPRQEHYLGEYTESSFRGAIVMLVVSVVLIAAIWLLYSWALSQPGIRDPNGAIDRFVGSVAAAALQ
ncbi:MAG TPA: hypothetical protein VF494_05860 [Candidatus Limnocylindrales bacterium]